MFYAHIRNNNLLDITQVEYLDEDIQNIEVSEKIYNDYLNNPLKYTYKNGNIIKNKDFEKLLEQQERERISKLSMTKYDLYKYLLAPSGISYEQLQEVLDGNPDLRVAWDLCARVYRGDTNFIEGVKNFIPTMTDEILDNIFEEYGE